jgi:hypothetical protein
METIMKLKLVIALTCTLLALAGCVVEPYGGRGGYGGGGDYGHRVWHE